ncbi:MAG: SGNH/GDSL hydrolase family protein [Pirellulales bacterium]|nr:SGNH/GDSL hydrolase family protein [Pirellulales bacterium]
MEIKRSLWPVVLSAFAYGWLVIVAPNGLHAASPDKTEANLRQLLIESDRVVVLGDSITFSGRWVSYLTCWMETAGTSARVIDMALPSETVSGLSENGHAGGKFPRPDLHERLDRVLRISRPDVVLACYGMNCGIYQPFDTERFTKFREGSIRLHEKVEGIGAKIIHLTPPVYDQRPDKRGPAGLTDYEDVLQQYSAWLLSMRQNGWMVIDVHGPMKDALELNRASNPSFVFAPDTVHPGHEGHWAMCRAILDDAGVPRTWSTQRTEPLLPRVTQRLEILRNAYISAAGHSRPGVPQGLPIDKAITEANRLTALIRSDQ